MLRKRNKPAARPRTTPTGSGLHPLSTDWCRKGISSWSGSFIERSSCEESPQSSNLTPESKPCANNSGKKGQTSSRGCGWFQHSSGRADFVHVKHRNGIRTKKTASRGGFVHWIGPSAGRFPAVSPTVPDFRGFRQQMRRPAKSPLQREECAGHCQWSTCYMLQRKEMQELKGRLHA